jgi:Tfp pilus assembly protein PilX
MNQIPRQTPQRQQGAALVVGLLLLLVVTMVGVSSMRNTTIQEKMSGNLRDQNLSFQAAETALNTGESILQEDYARKLRLMSKPGYLPAPPAPNTKYCGTDVGTNPTVGIPPAPPVPNQTNTLSPCGDIATGTLSMWIWLMDGPDPTSTNTTSWWWETDRQSFENWWNKTTSKSNLVANTLTGTLIPLENIDADRQPRYVIEEFAYAAADPREVSMQKIRRLDENLAEDNAKAYNRFRHYYRVTTIGQGGSDSSLAMLQSTIFRIYYLPAQ